MGDSLLELVSGVGQLLLYLQQLLLGLVGARDLLLVLDQGVLKGLGAFVGVLQLQVEQRSVTLGAAGGVPTVVACGAVDHHGCAAQHCAQHEPERTGA